MPRVYVRRDPADRFTEKYRVDPSGCWIWTGAIGAEGYGRFGYPSRQTRLAHRVAHVLFIGPIPDGYQVDHICAVKACVNPDHLEAVTPLVNTRRALPWVNGQARRTHCPQGHEYTEENTRLSFQLGRNGRPRRNRHCRTCDALRQLERSRQRRESGGGPTDQPANTSANRVDAAG